MAAGLSGRPAAAAPRTVRSTTVTVPDGSRTFSALLVQRSGEADRDYPVVGFGHGSQTGLLPSHSQFATDLLASVRWAQQTQPNADPDKDALVGHSMGAALPSSGRVSGPGRLRAATMSHRRC